MRSSPTLTPRLVFKLWLALGLLILGMAATYILITSYFSNQHHLATQQQINAPLAQHIIDEKFASAEPFLEDGSVNKVVFGDLMHDMMAVNRSIEVYLLKDNGEILYSVVLQDNTGKRTQYVDTKPIVDFIASDYKGFCLGDDPRDPTERKIFSVAPFTKNGKSGYIYIILSGEVYQLASANIFNEYVTSFGAGAIGLTTLFTIAIGFLLIWFITKNLRTITQVVTKFKDGDLTARITQPEKSDIAVFANTFNDMADTITASIEEVRSVDELRRQLVANVSHDLRTPLSILKGYAETLQEKSESLTKEESARYLQVISSNSDKLTNLVEQLFEYSNLEAKQIEPFKEQFSITDLCLDLVSEYEIIAKKKEIKLSLSVKNNESILVYADISLIERALQNLIDNALKFTRSGGFIKVELEKNGDSCSILVNDSGIGIDEEMHSTIFDRFEQTSESFKKNGAGLGLAIVKKILELHECTITVLSQKNKGSSFVFQLPLAV